METFTLRQRVEQADFDTVLSELYGGEQVDAARGRCRQVICDFEHTFGVCPEALFSAPGRTEVGGNHTDHQHGRVLAAAVDLDILAAVRPSHNGLIRLQSQGYSMLEVDLSDLDPREDEINTSAALIRGIAARMRGLGCSVESAGFDACLVSNVPGGSGLSSSAAFEVLIGAILNDLFMGGRFSPVELAQIGQYAENVYFGKPCGLMDQMASAVGSVVAIDFRDTAAPEVRQINLDLHASGYAMCILDSCAGHADLTSEYTAIPAEMKLVSSCFGKEVLREVSEKEFLAALPRVRQAAGDRGALRAFHFFRDNRLAQEEAQALTEGDFQKFLSLIRASGQSSAMYLQNVVPAGAVRNQELMVTIALCEALLGERGAVRVHGGGFGGTAQAFVPLDMLERFKAETEAVLGEGSCHVVSVRPVGGVRLT